MLKLYKIVCLIFLSLFITHYPCKSTELNNVSTIISFIQNVLLPIEDTSTTTIEAKELLYESSTNRLTSWENDYLPSENMTISSTSNSDQLDGVSEMIPSSLQSKILPIENLTIPMQAKTLATEISMNKSGLEEHVLIKNVTTQNISKVNKKLKQKNFNKDRIINGQRAVNGQFPYQAGILVRMRNNQYHLTCGGSILNESFVLTAAHCYSGNNDYYVIAGDVDHLAPGIKKHKVEKFLIRKQYSRVTLISDIAIIKIEDTFWNGYREYWDGTDMTTLIAPIQLIDYAIKDKTKAIVSGWGKTRDTGKASRYLLWIELRMMSKWWCMIKNIHWLSGMICLESFDKAVCQGDSGGPAVVNHKLAGIVSWGKGACVNMQNPNVFTDVYHYRQWILYNQSRAIHPSLILITANIIGLALYLGK